MKNLCTAVLCVCITLFNLCVNAQTASSNKIPLNEPDYNKPRLFEDLPDRISFNPASLSNLFTLRVGEQATIPVTPSFTLNGIVISTSKDQQVLSVVIRCTNRQGARLTLTKVTDTNNSVKYIGRILSLQHGDSYEIVFENNQYFLKKKGLYDLVNE